MRWFSLHITLKQTDPVFTHTTAHELRTVLHNGLCQDANGRQTMFCVDDVVGHSHVSLNMLSDVRWTRGDY